MILDTWLCCMCVYDAHIYDPGPRSWSMLVCMVHISMIRLKFCHGRTDGRTNKAILGVGCSLILDSDAYVYDAHIYDSRSLILIHTCMMHLSMFLDPWLYCMCVWCTYLWSWTLTLMHVCMMHISMILDLDPEACMYVWCMYLWCGKFCHERTDEQGDSRSRIWSFGHFFSLIILGSV